MSRWRRLRVVLSGPLWSLGTWLAARRRPAVREEHVRQQIYRAEARSMGLRMTGWLRDRLRPRWLRVRGEDEPEDDS